MDSSVVRNAARDKNGSTRINILDGSWKWPGEFTGFNLVDYR